MRAEQILMYHTNNTGDDQPMKQRPWEYVCEAERGSELVQKIKKGDKGDIQKCCSKTIAQQNISIKQMGMKKTMINLNEYLLGYSFFQLY